MLQVKSKGERKIDFHQFEAALDALGPMKFPGDAAAGAHIRELLLAAGGPKVDGAVQPATDGGIFAKLTDTSQYTGSHRERFDESGHGRGKDGRTDLVGGVKDLSQAVRPELHPSSAVKVGGPSGSSSARRDSTGSTGGGAAAAAAAPRRDSLPSSGRRGSSVERSGPSGRRGSSVERSGVAATGGSGSARSRSRSPAPGLDAGSGGAIAAGGGDLPSIFHAYAAFGGGHGDELDSAKFAKLCREAGIVTSGKAPAGTAAITPASVDMAFTKVKEKAKRSITYQQFLHALQVRAPRCRSLRSLHCSFPGHWHVLLPARQQSCGI